MRLRPLHAALAIALAAAIGATAAAANAPAAQHAAKDAMPAWKAQGLLRDLNDVIAAERAAESSLPNVKKFHEDLYKSLGKLAYVKLEASDYDDAHSKKVHSYGGHALDEDISALKEAMKAHPNIARIRKLMGLAMEFKQVALTNLQVLATPPPPPPTPPPPPPTPQPGQIYGCFFVTNNGNTSTVNNEFTEANAGGFSGTMNFNGDGVNQTFPFTFPAGSNPSTIVQVPIGQLGAAAVTVIVNVPGGSPVTGVMMVDVNAANDGGPQTCTPAPLPSK
ncbi:MAG TPA: hypothetical protein VMT59_13670 [Gaiellaceae bacterium]|nr:hypothetical protein [Gaiellaceae bacterium]